jgi:DNA-binding response OmpR family regulator
MKDVKQLKKHLIKKGLVSRLDLMKAEDYAMTAKIPLDEALVFLDLIDLKDLGKALSSFYKVPYRPLLDTNPPSKAKDLVSLELAEKWHIFPVEFNPWEGFLTLAMSDPKDMEKTLILENNLFALYRITYTVASDMEIQEAIARHYKGVKDVQKSRAELKLPEDFTILPDEGRIEIPESDREVLTHTQHLLLLEPELNRARAFRALLELEGIKGITWASTLKDAKKFIGKGGFDTLLVNGNVFNREGAWVKELKEKTPRVDIFYYHNFSPLLLQQVYTYEQMSRAMISMADFFVGQVLKDQPKRLAEIRLCAKYGKLLALRLGLDGAKVDAIVLAAWLSVPELQRSFLESVKTPYPLSEIITSVKGLKHSGRNVEAIIFGMVKGYIEVIADHPETRGDLSAVREILLKQFPHPEDEPILESFLHLLREDQLLQDVGKITGRILIVDPEVFEDSGIYLRLSNDGYQLKVVNTTGDAMNFLSDVRVDAIISESHLPDEDGLNFCRKVKTQSKFHDILFMVLTEDATSGLAARSLEAGADDFLQKPVDLELLSLKLSRALAKKGRGKAQQGVSGSLNDMSLTDLVQILSAGDKDVLITLEGGMRKGEIFIKQGEVIHAATTDVSGEDAFYQIMRWKDVNFSVVPCHEFPERTINMSLMSLLMEGARLMDEAAAEETLEE